MEKPIQYTVQDSPLYKLSSKKRMFSILKMTAEESVALRRRKVYNCFKTTDKYRSELPALKHKARKIQSPEAVLKRVQARLSDLLVRIELPIYLHSARKGCSYKSNARAHVFGHSVARVDIKKFYERTYITYIQNYFLNVLECSHDVAHRLSEIVSFYRRLPTGSPASPIMSFLAYMPMFNELHVLATSMGLTMTVYVDDVVVSGPGLASKFIQPAQTIIARYGLCAHKFSTSCAGQPMVITGLQLSATGESAPPTRFRKIRALETELRRTVDAEHKVILLKALIGQYREGKGIIPNALSHANRHQRLLEALPAGVPLRGAKLHRHGSTIKPVGQRSHVKVAAPK